MDVILERSTGKPRGLAFVNMTTESEVKAVLANCPHMINGSAILVRSAYAKNSK